MGIRISHPPGTISWVDLSTSDVPAAKAFYGELFGWDCEDMPAGEGMTYSMCRLDGRYVGAIFQGSQQPHWQVYVTVESADAAAERIAALGGEVLDGPFDIPPAGRTAAARDPQGAFFAVWEPGDHIGAEVVNAHGALTWNELFTTDVAAAADFYGGVFGWTRGDSNLGEDYFVISNGGRANGGIQRLGPDEGHIPPHWNVCFGANDVDATFEQATAAGAGTIHAPMDIPIGRFAVLTDPQGAPFAIFAGDLDD